jgi:hypothetical protein
VTKPVAISALVFIVISYIILSFVWVGGTLPEKFQGKNNANT